MVYVFGAYTLDPQRYEVRRAGQPVHVRRKVFQVLAYLLAQRARVVPKQELCEQAWPGQFISDATLDDCLAEARRAVGDSGRAQQVIKTVHGLGYRWVAAVREQHDPAADVALSPSAVHPESRHTVPPPPDGERKLATVLACTLANTAALMATLEPEAWYTLRQQLFTCAQEEVQRYEGTIQYFTEDGFLAFLGVPVAHEDHAQRAVLAALSLLARVQQQRVYPGALQGETLAVCIGIHTGQVVVGRMGDDLRPTVLSLGDTTHLAQRLLHLASPGAVVLSEATRHWLHGTIRLEAIGPVSGHGAVGPMPAYRALGRAPQALPWQRGRIVSPFVGRARELAVLGAVLAQVEERHGQVVGLVGEPGMGKSRLLYEFRRQVQERQYTYWAGQCVSYGGATPYLPLLDLLRHAWGLTEADDSATRIAKIYEGLRVVGMAPDAWGPPLLQLLGLGPDAEALAALSAQARRTRIFDALVHLILHTSRQRTLILEIENLHWIDPTSEEWLLALVERLAGVPVLLLTSYRPGYRPPWIDKSYATQLVLPRLTAADSRRLVQAILHPVSVAATFVQTLLTKADGNPFFLEELTWTVREHSSPAAPLVLPETVQAVVAARLDRLEPDAKRLLQVAAVIGTDVPVPLLHAITALPEDALRQILNRLQAAEFLYETHLNAEPAYTFKHVLTQEAAYHSLLTNTRQRYHQQIAQVLVEHFPATVETQPALVAQHYTAGGLPASALPYWQRAGEHAVARSAHVEAISHLTTALALLQTLPDTPERAYHELLLQTTLGPALMATRGYTTPEVEAAYSRALELCRQVGETPQLFVTLMGLWQFYLVRAQHQTARELAERLLSLAQSVGDPALLVQAHRALGEAFQNLGELGLAQEHLAQGSVLYDPQHHRFHAILHDPGVFCLALEAWVLWLLGYPEQARQHSQAALTLARALSHPHTLAAVLFFVAMLHQCRRERHLARDRAEATIALAREQGLPDWVVYGTIVQGWALAVQGQWEEGIAQIQQNLVALQATGAQIGQPGFLTLLAEAYAAAGQVDAGLDVLSKALALVDHTGERYREAELYRLKGELLWRQTVPDVSQAAACLQQALTVARRQQARSWELRAAMSLARLWQRQGKQSAARELLAPVYGWFTEGFDTVDLQEARALLDELSP
jgi:predicted ATPase/class 3 adenylate cyclase